MNRGQNVHSGTSNISWRKLFFPLLSVWDSGSIYKHYTVSRRVKSPHEFLNSFFLLTELLRDIYGILRDRQARNFNQNRADQFGFVSASPEVVVSMFSCHWKSAWNPLRQKPPLIFSPLRSSPALPSCSSSPPPSASCLAFWLTMMEIKGQCELKALLPHLNLIKVNLALSLACDSLHAASMSNSSYFYEHSSGIKSNSDLPGNCVFVKLPQCCLLGWA